MVGPHALPAGACPARAARPHLTTAAVGVKRARLRGQHLRLPGYEAGDGGAGGAGGPTLEIFQYDEVEAQGRPVANRAGFGHIAFAVDDVAATLEELVAAGGARHGDVVSTHVAGVGTLTFTYARDPEGNLIELQAWT